MKTSDAIFNLPYSEDVSRRDGMIIQSRKAFAQGLGIFVCPLNLVDEGVHLATGYNSQGTNSTIRFDAQGLSTTAGTKHSVFALAEVTKTLVIAPGQSLSILH